MMERRRRWREVALVFGALLLVAVLRWWPELSGRAAFVAEDIPRLNLPVRAYLGDWLRQNVLVLWTPLLQRGFPIFAESQMGGLYPLRLLHGLPLAPWTALAWDVVLHLAWAGAGLYCFLRASRLRPLAALLPAVAFAFSAPLVARHQHTNVLEALSWWPWILAGIELGLDRQRRGWLGAGFALGLMALCGHAQFVVYGEYLAISYALARIVVLPERRAALLGLAGALALGAGIAAAQYLPLAELARHSLRSGGVWEAGEQALKPAHLPLFLAPGFWGPLFSPEHVRPAQRWEVVAYVGVLPVILALIAVGRTGRRVGFWLGIGLLALIAAVGDRLGIGALLGYLPGWGGFRAPARLLAWFVLALLILAGHGLEAVLAGRFHWCRRWTFWSGLFLGGTVAALVGLPPVVEEVAGAGEAARQSLALLAIFGALSLLWLAKCPHLPRVAVGLVLVDLLVCGWTLTPSEPASYYRDLPEAKPGRVAVGPGQAGPLRWYEPDTNLLLGQDNLHNMSPLTLRAPVELWDAAQQGPPDADLRVLRLLGVQWGPSPDGQRLIPLEAPLEETIRAVAGIDARESAEAVRRRLLEPDYDPRRFALRVGGNDVIQLSPGPSYAIKVTRRPNRISGYLAASDRTLWVLDAMPYPGLTLAVDGHPNAVQVVNDVQMLAATNGSGLHSLALVFDSFTIRLGRFLALLAVAGAVMVAIAGRASDE